VPVGRPSWYGSDRRQALPPNWPTLRAEADRRNPLRICHACGRPGGEALDHVNGDRDDNRQENLDWIHDWRSVKEGRSPVNCHAAKTARDRPSIHRAEEHPAQALRRTRGSGAPSEEFRHGRASY
jgi:hypothetical protein